MNSCSASCYLFIFIGTTLPFLALRSFFLCSMMRCMREALFATFSFFVISFFFLGSERLVLVIPIVVFFLILNKYIIK
jgi:hypothetical protein